MWLLPMQSPMTQSSSIAGSQLSDSSFIFFLECSLVPHRPTHAIWKKGRSLHQSKSDARAMHETQQHDHHRCTGSKQLNKFILIKKHAALDARLFKYQAGIFWVY